MSAIVKLVQGSPEWHAHRAQYRNASETAIVMGESPWQTPYQLWELRTGRRQPEVNAAMARGTALEPQARAAYEVAHRPRDAAAGAGRGGLLGQSGRPDLRG